MKELNGRELAGYIKERQAHMVAGMARKPKLLIIRDSENPVILKYVNLKKKYGEDIGVEVLDFFAKNTDEIRTKILEANVDDEIDGMIIQLPILENEKVDELVSLISPEKDVDGLNFTTENELRKFESATATAIHWLLNGYNIELGGKQIAIVGRGRLVGAPLERMWENSGYDVTIFHRGSNMNELVNYDIIVSATGVPHLIKNDMVADGVVIVDAGTASEGGVLVGDVDDAVRAREDLGAITPKIGGVGPLTVACLFDHVIAAAQNK